MRKLILVVVLVSDVLACGGPLCADENLNTANVTACEGQGAPDGYCQCAVDNVFSRFSCSDIQAGKPSIADVEDACKACGPQYNITCG